jgi:hypothetical protein
VAQRRGRKWLAQPGGAAAATGCSGCKGWRSASALRLELFKRGFSRRGITAIYWMRRSALIPVLCLFAVACSTRDFLTRRSAAELITASNVFKSPQQFFLRTGVVSNKDYGSPEYLVLQRHGWITGVTVPCTGDVSPPPCWDVALTPIGVETFRELIPSGATAKQYFPVTTAKRELTVVTGITFDGNRADVDFTWKWVPSNEVGAALVNAGVGLRSTVLFRHYDDGWRVVDGSPAKASQSLEDALKDAEPEQ